VADPEGLGSIQSFARPGGNVTGVTDLELDLGPKRLQMFQEMIPTLKRVLFPYHPAEAYAVRMAKVYREAAQHLGIELIERTVQSEAEARTLLLQLRKDEVDGLLSPYTNALNIAGFIMEVEKQQAIPTMYSSAFYPERGGLTSYAPNSYETGKQAARLVDKILKGAKPAELPVEVNPQIEFAVNLKTVHALGLSIAPEVLYQANKIMR
jgi:putative ABC transport system substrate-binding protein